MRTKSKEGLPNKVYFLDGLLQGIGITLFGGPIFIAGFLLGLVGTLILLGLCVAVYLTTRAVVQSSTLFSGQGKSEIWWLGAILGFSTVMLVFFPLISMQLN